MITRADDYTLVLDNDGVRGKRINTVQGCEYVKLELDAGKEIPEHALDIPVTFLVLQGNGTALLEGNEFNATAGDLIAVEAGAHRAWKNSSNDELHVLVIKHLGKS